MALSELKIKNLKPRDKRYFVSDGQGLYIAVMQTGEKYWYHRTWENGKEHKRSLGRYPDIGLKEARELKYKSVAPKQELFGAIIDDWFQLHYADRKENTRKGVRSLITRFILPAFSTRPINKITPREVFEFARDIGKKSMITGQKVRNIISSVFTYAIAAGLCEWNPAAQIGGALPHYKVIHHFSTIQTEEQARELMRIIDGYNGNPVSRIALLLLAYTFVRRNELRLAQWAEIDGDEWRIPAERMKMKREHVVPLSRQAAALFAELRTITAHPVFCFVLPFHCCPISDGLLNYIMKHMPTEATPHSFRGMASTLLNEHGWPPDVIERQLAHAPANAVRAAYNRAEYMEERRRMMQWWGDYLDGLRG